MTNDSIAKCVKDGWGSKSGRLVTVVMGKAEEWQQWRHRRRSWRSVLKEKLIGLMGRCNVWSKGEEKMWKHSQVSCSWERGNIYRQVKTRRIWI